jgi:probable F420-dependent oxidoreductase
MRFGLQLAHVDWSRLHDVAQAAEGMGFHAVYFPDHLVHEGPERQQQELPTHDPIIEAAVVAQATRRIRVGHLVLANPFRHPALTARSLASLDQLSGGRLVAGLGSGWTETEFRMTGIPFPDIGTRLRMLDEALTCIDGLWRDEPFSFTGEFYRFRDATLRVRPVQRPRPPFLLGGSGKGLLRIAARHADAVNIISGTGREGYISMAAVGKLTDATFRAKVRFLREEARRHGRDADRIEVSQTLFTILITDSREASRVTAESFGKMLGLAPGEVLRSPLTLIGTPEECIAELKRREREWSVAETIFSGRSEEVLRRLADEVLPHV